MVLGIFCLFCSFLVLFLAFVALSGSYSNLNEKIISLVSLGVSPFLLVCLGLALVKHYENKNATE